RRPSSVRCARETVCRRIGERRPPRVCARHGDARRFRGAVPHADRRRRTARHLERAVPAAPSRLLSRHQRSAARDRDARSRGIPVARASVDFDPSTLILYRWLPVAGVAGCWRCWLLALLVAGCPPATPATSPQQPVTSNQQPLLEEHFQTELNVAIARLRSHPSERSVGRIRLRVAQIRIVREVERFRAELDARAARRAERLEQREIPILLMRTANGIASRIAERSR